MSVIDQLRGLEERVSNRMAELQPLVNEYNELQQVADRLGIEPAEGQKRRAPRGRSAGAKGRRRRPASAKQAASANLTPESTPRGTRRRAKAGARHEQLLQLVKLRPGITVTEAGKELGVDPTSLYRVVRRLEQDKQVKKQGRSLQPA